MKTTTPLHRIPTTLAVIAFGMAFASLARAELIYGVGTNGTTDSLFDFNSSSPNTITTIGNISGLTSGQTLEGITFSPNGTLYALGYVETSGASQGQSQLYTVNLGTGALTAVNSTPVNLGFSQGGASSVSFGLQFTSGGNAIQVIDGGGDIFQLNPSTGGIVGGSVGSVSYSPNPSAGNVPQWADLSFNGAGSMYTIDETNNQLGLASGNTIAPIGNGFGISTRGPGTMGFEISKSSGTAYLQTDTDDSGVADDLYTVNLGTGVVSSVGQIGTDSNFNTIDIAVAPVPEPGTIGMLMAGAGILVAFLRFRRRAHLS
jgi:hypothetical protein